MKDMCAQNVEKLTLWTLMVDCLLYVSAKLHPCAFAQYNCKDILVNQFFILPTTHSYRGCFIGSL